ncbi:hypothetical protein EVAR_27417_1 [Eumeta japonica]|uniref:Uncharacterized protein n=1 Tax=Eumeta variegata TaxID=151549 RepID=A0A4C1VKA4_EUMVA|nr:hypothetical protein EVAR_27417_1 [Eumeta japonica]
MLRASILTQTNEGYRGFIGNGYCIRDVFNLSVLRVARSSAGFYGGETVNDSFRGVGASPPPGVQLFFNFSPPSESSGRMRPALQASLYEVVPDDVSKM